MFGILLVLAFIAILAFGIIKSHFPSQASCAKDASRNSIEAAIGDLACRAAVPALIPPPEVR
jgi:hypothetical protein